MTASNQVKSIESAAKDLVEFAWMDSTRFAPRVPWDLLWELRDALEREGIKLDIKEP